MPQFTAADQTGSRLHPAKGERQLSMPRRGTCQTADEIEEVFLRFGLAEQVSRL
jgi:hypothetical protein